MQRALRMRLKPLKLTHMHAELQQLSGRGGESEDPAGPVPLQYLLNMIIRQTNMAPKAPMLSFRRCPSCTSSQFSPQQPSGQMQRYRRRGSKLMHVPPFRQGMSKHSLRSTQPLVSADMMRPSLHLQCQSNKWSQRVRLREQVKFQCIVCKIHVVHNFLKARNFLFQTKAKKEKMLVSWRCCRISQLPARPLCAH